MLSVCTLEPAFKIGSSSEGRYNASPAGCSPLLRLRVGEAVEQSGTLWLQSSEICRHSTSHQTKSRLMICPHRLPLPLTHLSSGHKFPCSYQLPYASPPPSLCRTWKIDGSKTKFYMPGACHSLSRKENIPPYASLIICILSHADMVLKSQGKGMLGKGRV